MKTLDKHQQLRARLFLWRASLRNCQPSERSLVRNYLQNTAIEWYKKLKNDDPLLSALSAPNLWSIWLEEQPRNIAPHYASMARYGRSQFIHGIQQAKADSPHKKRTRKAI